MARVRVLIAAAVVVALPLCAQQPPADAGPRPPAAREGGGRPGAGGGDRQPGAGFRGGPMQGPGAMVSGADAIRRFDANGNLLIEEEELRTGLNQIKAKMDGARAILLKAFDANGNQKLDGDELQKVQDFIWAIMGGRPYDRNNDWELSEAELGEAWDQLSERSQHLNDGMMQRFDKNQDGKLDEVEVAAAKESFRAMMEQGWRRPEGGAPQQGGGAARPPAPQPPAPVPAPRPPPAP